MGTGLVFSGDLRELRHIKEYDHPVYKYDQLVLRVFDDVKIPYNSETESIVRIADKEIRTVNLDLAKFSSCNFNFTILKENGWTVIKVKSNDDTHFPENIEICVIEALEFVLAQSVWWTVLEKFTDQKLETNSIRAYFAEKNKPRLSPPIEFRDTDKTGYVWNLFDKYLQYVINYHEKTKWHPISVQLDLVREATQGPLATEALALSIAVESILKSEFMKLCKPVPELNQEIKSACNYFDNWNGSDEFKIRLKGSLNAMMNPNPITAMKALININAITKEQKNAWEKLRHPIAHGHQINDNKLQEYVKLCDTVCVLLYHLIFHAIGYKGVYSDYSIYGWPLREYPTNPKVEFIDHPP